MFTVANCGGSRFSLPHQAIANMKPSFALLLLLVRLVDLLELLDNFFHMLASRGFPFGLFNPVNKPVFLGVRQLFKQAIRH